MSKYSPIIKSGGVLIWEDLLGSVWFEALKAEGLAQRATAKIQYKEKADGALQYSDPDRYYLSADGSEVQTGIYHDIGLHKCLGELCGRSVRPTGIQGTYSYYEQPGHYLGLHRDIHGCDLTLITCLYREDQDSTSGALRLYVKSTRQPISEIDSNTQFRDIHVQSGQTVLLLGRCVPHEVRACGSQFKRYISVLCFKMT